jgi:endonuclease/exonuclease/phosphatase family metal-dependent hydrolase
MVDTHFRLRVATANLKRGGYDPTTRFHDHSRLKRILSPLKHPPHVLFLSECTRYVDYDSEPLFDVLELLSTMWSNRTGPDGQPHGYIPYAGHISEVDGSVNVPGLFVDTRHVRRLRWRRPSTNRSVLANTLDAQINGHDFTLKSLHWNGSRGEYGFAMQADQDGQLGSRNAIVAGDFNTTSSADGETIHPHWGARCDQAGRPWQRSQKGVYTPSGWETNTYAYDRFVQHGWADAGAVAKDFSVTTVTGDSDLRIDRIALSTRSPAAFVPGSYQVYRRNRDVGISDHLMVSCAIDIAPPPPGHTAGTPRLHQIHSGRFDRDALDTLRDDAASA